MRKQSIKTAKGKEHIADKKEEQHLRCSPKKGEEQAKEQNSQAGRYMQKSDKGLLGAVITTQIGGKERED